MFKFFVVAVACSFFLPALASSARLSTRQAGSVDGTTGGGNSTTTDGGGTTGGTDSDDPLDNGDIPQQCLSPCTQFMNITRSCQESSCICTNPNFQLLEVCADCVTFYGNATAQIMTEAQSEADGLVQECNSAGFQINPITITPVSPIPTPTNSSAGPAATGSLTNTTSTIILTSTSSTSPTTSPSPASSSTSGDYPVYTKASVAWVWGLAALVVTLL